MGETLAEWRPEGARNFVRPGDVVKVLPSRPGKHDGFEARVDKIVADEEGNVRHLEVFGGRHGQIQFHAVRPDRVQRVAQVRNGEQRQRRR